MISGRVAPYKNRTSRRLSAGISPIKEEPEVQTFMLVELMVTLYVISLLVDQASMR